MQHRLSITLHTTTKMEKEIYITYRFNPADYDANGRRKNDGNTFREVVKEYERDFHQVHSSDYALNLYANSTTMGLLARSCDAAPFLVYGMDLTQGQTFDPDKDPFANHEMDKNSKYIYVYGIDSAFMTEYDDNGYPILDENSEIFPLTLLVDDTMPEGTIRLSAPTSDDDGEDTDDVIVGVPKFEYA